MPLPLDPPVTSVCATVQSKVAPAGVEVSAMPVEVPEQIACVAGVASAVGIGFTVITTFTGTPGQPASVGVML